MEREDRASSELGHDHHPQAIRERIDDSQPGYLGDALLGAVDGLVTTFAVVAGAVGGGFGSQVVIVLGIATFLAFLLIGAIPLVPFLIPGLELGPAFGVSIVVTGVAFVGVGVGKSLALDRPAWRSGLETLLMGGGAAGLAYLVGHWLRQTYGV